MKRTATRTSKRVRPRQEPTRAPKYVYFFAAGKAEGSSALRHLLGGKGCELAEMTNLGVPVPPGFTITTQAWAAYHAAGGKHPPGLWSQVVANLGPARGRGRQSAGPCRAAPSRLRPLGSAGFHARHDGHRPQPRPERSDGRGAGALDEERALRLGLLPALPHDLRRRRARHRAPGLRRAAGPRQGQGRGEDRRRRARAGPARAGRGVQAPGAGADGAALSPGPDGAAPPGHQCGVRLLVREEGGGLPAHPSAARRLGHCGHRDGHGLRQPRRDVGHRRLLLARSLVRGEALLR